MGVNTRLVNLPGLEGKREAALVWWAKGPELALWREEQDNWVLVTLTVERWANRTAPWELSFHFHGSLESEMSHISKCRKGKRPRLAFPAPCPLLVTSDLLSRPLQQDWWQKEIYLLLKNGNSLVGFFSAYCKRCRQLHKAVYKANEITSFHYPEIAPVSILVSGFLHLVFLCIHLPGHPQLSWGPKTE